MSVSCFGRHDVVVICICLPQFCCCFCLCIGNIDLAAAVIISASKSFSTNTNAVKKPAPREGSKEKKVNRDEKIPRSKSLGAVKGWWQLL